MENERERLKMNNFGKRNEKKIQLTLIDKTDTNANNGERRGGRGSQTHFYLTPPSHHTRTFTLFSLTHAHKHTRTFKLFSLTHAHTNPKLCLLVLEKCLKFTSYGKK